MTFDLEQIAAANLKYAQGVIIKLSHELGEKKMIINGLMRDVKRLRYEIKCKNDELAKLKDVEPIDGAAKDD